MIVKNESTVIQRCLQSAKPIIDYWVIVDTGSSDDTKDIIKDFMKDIPGELHEKPFVDFSYSRNHALSLAKDKADYILFIDADETLIYDKDFALPILDKDFFYIQTQFNGTTYNRVQLIKSSLNWQWKGVLHEVIDTSEAKSFGILQGVANLVKTDGARSQDPKKFQKDAQLLEKALEKDPLNTRNVFYLAQSYKDAEDYEAALKNYQKRVLMGGWDQEVFWSLLQIGILNEKLEKPTEEIIYGYQNAYDYRSSRIEPLYYLTNFYRNSKNFLAGYEAALKGLTIKGSQDILFVEKWIYDYGLLLEFSICAYSMEKYAESLLASYLILANPTIPDNIRTCVNNNLIWIKGGYNNRLLSKPQSNLK